jgi:hypothetical protein
MKETSWHAGIRIGLGTIAVALLAACSASGEDADSASSASCSAHTSPAATKPSRDVSFEREVLPIFQASCSFTSCHGSPGLNSIYLGAKGRVTDASTIRTALLEQRPKALASMPYVTPSDTGNSFLLRKLDGAFCNLDCEDGKCGERMPKGGDPLAPAALETIETWIASGAPDN